MSKIKNQVELDLMSQVARMTGLPIMGTDPKSLDGFLFVQKAAQEKGDSFSLKDASALKTEFEQKWKVDNGHGPM